LWWQVILVRGDVERLGDEPLKSCAGKLVEEKPKTARGRASKWAAAA